MSADVRILHAKDGVSGDAEVSELVTRKQVVDEHIVRLLEEALAEAKAGDFVAAGLALIHRDGRPATRFAKTDNSTALLGATALLQHDIIEAMSE